MGPKLRPREIRHQIRLNGQGQEVKVFPQAGTVSPGSVGFQVGAALAVVGIFTLDAYAGVYMQAYGAGGYHGVLQVDGGIDYLSERPGGQAIGREVPFFQLGLHALQFGPAADLFLPFLLQGDFSFEHPPGRAQPVRGAEASQGRMIGLEGGFNKELFPVDPVLVFLVVFVLVAVRSGNRFVAFKRILQPGFVFPAHSGLIQHPCLKIRVPDLLFFDFVQHLGLCGVPDFLFYVSALVAYGETKHIRLLVGKLPVQVGFPQQFLGFVRHLNPGLSQDIVQGQVLLRTGGHLPVSTAHVKGPSPLRMQGWGKGQKKQGQGYLTKGFHVLFLLGPKAIPRLRRRSRSRPMEAMRETAAPVR